MMGTEGSAVSDQEQSTLAIVCGGGSLPFAVADAVLGRGRPVFLLPIKGWADSDAVRRYPHAWMTLGRFGMPRLMALNAGCRDIVCIGTLVRPPLRALRLDWLTVRMLPQFYRLFRGGDDHLLSGISKLVEQQGFRLLGAHEVVPDILVPEGVMTRIRPTAAHLADAARGFALLEATGAFDVGQAVVVAQNRVLAVEAAEGTDAMLERVAALSRAGHIRLPPGSGVLVKAAKPGQDRRMDLPAMGPRTVEGVRQAGLAGIVARAGDVIVAEPAACTQAADRADLFVTGIAAKPKPSA
jgi:DUF1009 family protein